MKSIVATLSTLLVVCLVLVSCSEKAGSATADKKPEVRPYSIDVDNPLILKTFEDFKALALVGNDQKLAGICYKPSFDYYAGIREQIFSADKASIQAQTYVNQVMIMRTRIKADMDLLGKLDSAQLMGYFYRSGFVDKGSINFHGMGEITYDEATKTASAPVVINGQDAGGAYHFKREDNIWKIDISEAIPLVNQAIEDAMIAKGNAPAYMINLVLVSANDGNPVPEELWNPQK